MMEIATFCRRRASAALLAVCVTLGSATAVAQVRTIDPSNAIDGDLAPAQAAPKTIQPSPTYQQPSYPAPAYQPRAELPAANSPAAAAPVVTSPPPAAAGQSSGQLATTAAPTDTYRQDDLIGAAEGVFGKGAEGLARMIEDLLAKQGEPNGYIVGREAGGAFIFGVRYGSGTLFHKIEGQRPVYWTGPSVGFDAGANAGNTFVLVYNLHDTEELYERFPAGEGQAYIVGGLTASYLRKGDIVLIPIRIGAGLRLGVNAGYMKFSDEQRWVPF